jgi:hypothetical protein
MGEPAGPDVQISGILWQIHAPVHVEDISVTGMIW